MYVSNAAVCLVKVEEKYLMTWRSSVTLTRDSGVESLFEVEFQREWKNLKIIKCNFAPQFCFKREHKNLLWKIHYLEICIS